MKEMKEEYAEKKGEELASGVRNLSAAKKKEFGEDVGESRAVHEALMNCAMEDQDSMMIDNYAVIVSQYTYIVLWSVAFPLAPLFAFLVNIEHSAKSRYF